VSTLDQHWYAIDGLWRRIGSSPITPNQGTKPIIGVANGSNSQSAWNISEASYGPLRIRRSFTGAGVFPATFAASSAAIDSGVREAIWSFKPDCTTFASGGNDAWFNSFLDSIPSGQKVIFVLYHEPEDEISSGDFTLSAWQGANNHMGQLVHAKNRPELRTAIVMKGPWDFTPSNPAYYTEYWDSGFATSIDYIGLDPYSFGGVVNLADIPYFHDSLSWAIAKNKPILFPEFGCDDGGTANLKADWLQNAYQLGLSAGLYAMCYFDYNLEAGRSVKLTTSQSITAFADINTDSKAQ
jgi:hypothetical protein